MVEWLSGYRTKECLALVHADMYWSFGVHTWGGYGYCITFSDDYSRFGYVYRKSDALNKFIEFKAKFDNLLGKHIKVLQFDWGDKTGKFDSFRLSTGLFANYVNLGLHFKIERWKEDIKLWWT